MGLLAEIRASVAGSDPGGEVILVRFDWLCARRYSAGRREDFAEALPRDGWRKRQGHRVRLRIQNEPGRYGVSQRSHDPGDGLQRHLLESRSVSPERSHRGTARALRK